ncbi:hypothetical protein UFOVP380_10 [uncultured Caudovirales phage]|uniref:Uncharacterized protein n=1 Tax=uncultured Caudovirales phage TaxID=2100421 RepID=A0A6J7X2F6_9CAUD|nr:hypothetical protein UFOVP380_10 [uncultured Caudovirales phage]
MAFSLMVAAEGAWAHHPVGKETKEGLLALCKAMAAAGHAVQLEEGTTLGSVVLYSHEAGLHAPLPKADLPACFEGV